MDCCEGYAYSAYEFFFSSCLIAMHCVLVGVVYNVTLFAKYHPGGKAQLMRGAGQDCTELFDKV